MSVLLRFAVLLALLLPALLPAQPCYASLSGHGLPHDDHECKPHSAAGARRKLGNDHRCISQTSAAGIYDLRLSRGKYVARRPETYGLCTRRACRGSRAVSRSRPTCRDLSVEQAQRRLFPHCVSRPDRPRHRRISYCVSIFSPPRSHLWQPRYQVVPAVRALAIGALRRTMAKFRHAAKLTQTK